MALLRHSLGPNSCIRQLQSTPKHWRWRPIPRLTYSAHELRVNASMHASAKELWLQTSDKAAFTAALESGRFSAFVFGPDPAHQALAAAWSSLGRFRCLHLDSRGLLSETNTGKQVGEVVAVDGPEAARALEGRVGQQRGRRKVAAAGEDTEEAEAGWVGSEAASEWVLVLDAKDWKIIPAENLVALTQAPAVSSTSSSHTDSPAGLPPLRLLAAAGTAAEAQLMMEALQAGTAGALLTSNDPAQVRTLVSYISRRDAEESGHPDALLRYSVARVVAVRQLCMGDRACVDLAGLMQPGEGLLVGSFARCLALVHSECGESQYIASRPFRVNAGPVHAYVCCPAGRTRYLSELTSGEEVLVADPAGRCRTALVGRVKIERRPLVLVEVETSEDTGVAGEPPARHTGIAVAEFILEK
ncbi:hypothetical protein VOLCADRAFT_103266 [Volvox carteri f. nagariensis]|uniref:3-dehydroquinate synthase n=1 Tax=Volvox carteri f. nagariensis TaxID=3068 RepID=D8TKW1_VOLCA|nr:uncharacterized protein VOLCADRAFT_103266 [Volvox carteri f. nagariensis]EFJ51764.1 hypothetical protein VOLCADRAFT_103266 [Volvox carteri f. nagariensis]|eukprot:XP_002947174.1 hypothetical protein VOLCADRAFT_103266 [Volvox carteri f. nagariensis]